MNPEIYSTETFSPEAEAGASRRIEILEQRIAPLRRRLAEHPLYARIRSVRDLRIFMESHVFAVWDFMALLKTLQAELTCVAAPWVPTAYAESRRFINEIVLGEESDHFEGRAISHFELYIEAMRDAGADTRAIDALLEELRAGADLDRALASATMPEAARRFVQSTFAVIAEGRIEAVAAAFTFGREDLIPDMFRGLVRELDVEMSGGLGKFIWYLERHIEIDGEDHGPLSLRMIEDLCGESDAKWAAATDAAKTALEARIELWDGILEQIEGK